MPSNLDPAEMAEHDRLRELASILARGVQRLRESRSFSGKPPSENLPESAPERLEVSGETVLSVLTG